MEIIIAIQDCAVRVRSKAATLDCVVQWLARDFGRLLAPSPQQPLATIDLITPLSGSSSSVSSVTESSSLPSSPSPSSEAHQESRSLAPTRFCKIPGTRDPAVYGWGHERACFYSNGVIATTNTRGSHRDFEISGTDPKAVWEAAYCAILSTLGEALDDKGLHRVHALAFSHDQDRFLLVGPSGAGKSSLALQLRKNPAVRIFSDEMPLLDREVLLPFPLRIALSPAVAQALSQTSSLSFKRRRGGSKLLFSFTAKQVAAPAPVTKIFILKPHAGSPLIRKTHRLAGVAALVDGLVIGRGLPQMAEWMLRIGRLRKLVRIAFSRARTTFALLRQSQAVYEFRTGPDAMENARFLREFLHIPESGTTHATRPSHNLGGDIPGTTEAEPPGLGIS